MSGTIACMTTCIFKQSCTVEVHLASRHRSPRFARCRSCRTPRYQSDEAAVTPAVMPGNRASSQPSQPFAAQDAPTVNHQQQTQDVTVTNTASEKVAQHTERQDPESVESIEDAAVQIPQGPAGLAALGGAKAPPAAGGEGQQDGSEDGGEAAVELDGQAGSQEDLKFVQQAAIVTISGRIEDERSEVAPAAAAGMEGRATEGGKAGAADAGLNETGVHPGVTGRVQQQQLEDGEEEQEGGGSSSESDVDYAAVLERLQWLMSAEGPPTPPQAISSLSDLPAVHAVPDHTMGEGGPQRTLGSAGIRSHSGGGSKGVDQAHGNDGMIVNVADRAGVGIHTPSHSAEWVEDSSGIGSRSADQKLVGGGIFIDSADGHLKDPGLMLSTKCAVEADLGSAIPGSSTDQAEGGSTDQAKGGSTDQADVGGQVAQGGVAVAVTGPPSADGGEEGGLMCHCITCLMLRGGEEDEEGRMEVRQNLMTSFDLAGVAELIKTGKARRIICMCGAGISVSAGIPDFRTPGSGLYHRLEAYDLPYPQAVFEIDFFRTNPRPFFLLAKELLPGTFTPTPTHYFMKLLHTKGLLLRCFTQNIDSLEHQAGLPKEAVVAAHGNFDSARCVRCGRPHSTDHVRQAVFQGEGNSCYCTHPGCGGLVKPDIVFFGENLPERFWNLVPSDFPQADLLIVMGTSLVVQPFASLIDRVSDDTPRLLVNRERAGEVDPLLRASGYRKGFNFDEGNYRDALFEGECDKGVLELCRLLGWEEELEGLIKGGASPVTKA